MGIKSITCSPLSEPVDTHAVWSGPGTIFDRLVYIPWRSVVSIKLQGPPHQLESREKGGEKKRGSPLQ